LKLLEAECTKVSSRQAELEELIPALNNELTSRGVKLRSMEASPHLAKQHTALEKQITALANELKGLRREKSENSALLQGLVYHMEQLRSGKHGDPHAHIHHLASPDSTTGSRFHSAADTWAAVSLSLMLFGIAGLIFFAPNYLWSGLAVLSLLFLVLESILRGAFVATLGRLSMILALIAAFILAFHFWKYTLVAVLVGLGIYLLYERVRELTG
jgi:hypothetical protein